MPLNRFFLSCRTCGSTLGTIADYFSRGHWLLSLVSRFKTCPAIRSVGIILKQLSIIPTLHSDIISDVTVMLSSHSDARLGLMKKTTKTFFSGMFHLFGDCFSLRYCDSFVICEFVVYFFAKWLFLLCVAFCCVLRYVACLLCVALCCVLRYVVVGMRSCVCSVLLGFQVASDNVRANGK